MSPVEVEGVVGAGCSEEEVEEAKEVTPYLEGEEVEVELSHQEEEEVEEGLPRQQDEDPPLDLSLLRPSTKVLPARRSQIQQCGVLAWWTWQSRPTACDPPLYTPLDSLSPPVTAFS